MAVNLETLRIRSGDSARWIAREAWRLGRCDQALLESWVKAERENGQRGDAKFPALYSSYWIAQNASRAHRARLLKIIDYPQNLLS